MSDHEITGLETIRLQKAYETEGVDLPDGVFSNHGANAAILKAGNL